MLDHTVAVVIVCWNSRDLLDTCLGSIDRQTAGKSLVIVVDNGSEDGTQDHIRASYPTVQLIEAGRNLLFAAACNVGIRAALADPACRYVAFLNDDAHRGEHHAGIDRIAEHKHVVPGIDVQAPQIA